MPKVQEYKKKLVQDMTKLIRQYNIIGMVNMEDMPAPQLQAMRSELRGKVDIFMTKKRLMKIAIEKSKNEKKNIEELEKYFEGMPALIFTNENPFKLSKILQKSKTKAPAKAGQTAPNDIVINKGPTPFAPGPVISELSAVGLKVGVESGKVAVKEDTVIAKKGEKINPKVAEILTRLDIKPMEVGLGLVAAYEDGIIYQKDILAVDEKEYNDNINLAATQAFNLAFNITYVTKDNLPLLIGKAFNDTKALGISQNILDKGIIESLLSKAENEMLSLKNTTNIEITETQKETRPEEKKIEAPIQEKIDKKLSSESEKGLEKSKTFQKEEKVLEEEKKIIEEEKKLEKEKPKEVPVEQEVQEAVKEEEEQKLEKERIEKEKELEKLEKQKEEIKETKEPTKPEIKEIPKEAVDDKVSKMVEKTKKFIEGKEETASDIIEEVKKEELVEEKPEIQEKPQETEVQEEKPEIKEEIKEKIQEEKKEEKKIEEPIVKEVKEVPSAHDLQKEKEEEKGEDKETDQEHKEVEELTKELIKKGTLRKK